MNVLSRPRDVSGWLRGYLTLVALLMLVSGCVVGFNHPLLPGPDTPDPQDITGYWLISQDERQYVAQVQWLGRAR